MTTAPILFADFVPGAVIGEHDDTISDALILDFTALYGRREGVSPALLQMMMMRAYLAVVSPRPPGNIHARQRFTLLGRADAGDEVRTRITCADREERGERRRVTLGAAGSVAGRPLFSGEITMLWAR